MRLSIRGLFKTAGFDHLPTAMSIREEGRASRKAVIAVVAMRTSPMQHGLITSTRFRRGSPGDKALPLLMRQARPATFASAPITRERRPGKASHPPASFPVLEVRPFRELRLRCHHGR